MNKFEPIPKERTDAVNLLLRSCLTCDMFKEQEEQCTVYSARPPARIIAFGCNRYIEEIPF